MKLYKLRSEHLINDKIYFELPYYNTQLICSKDGFLYCKHSDFIIHKYLLEKYDDCPTYPLTYDRLVPHLFNKQQIYLNFESSKSGISNISFLYFISSGRNEPLFAEIYFQEIINFCKNSIDYKPNKILQSFTREQLESFLYNVYEDRSKYLIHPLKGLMYARHLSEPISIKENFLDFSDEGIIKLYNSELESLKKFGEIVAKQKSTGFENIENINDVPSFLIEPRGYMATPPLLCIISKHNISVQKISISFESKDNFKVSTSEILITEPLIRDMMLSSISQTEYFKKSPLKKGKKQIRGWQ